jgi:hydrocephalus-inducing protein
VRLDHLDCARAHGVCACVCMCVRVRARTRTRVSTSPSADMRTCLHCERSPKVTSLCPLYALPFRRYDDDVFRVEPSSGEIWPNSEAVVTVVFSPKEATQYIRTVFCDVTGRETRLPLKLRGEGLGPVLEFPTRVVDMGRVFVGSTHVFEVVARNTSVVEAPFRFVKDELQRHSAAAGRTLTVSPREGVVQAGGFQAFSVVFTSTVFGEVDDDVTLRVQGAAPGTEPSVRFIGSVIAPTFRLGSEEFNFGAVPWGFPTMRRNTLHNTSLVPITLRVRLPLEYPEASDLVVVPSAVTVDPGETVVLEATLTPTRRGVFDLFVTVDMDGVGDAVVTIPGDACLHCASRCCAT